MFPLTTLVVLEAMLKEMACLRERFETMNEEIKAELEEIKASQAATAEAVTNLSGDIATQSAKIQALTDALAAETISPETKALLDEVKAGQDAIEAQAQAAAAIVP